jgi:hypothetical protein
MNYSVNDNNNETITISIKNTVYDKMNFFINKLDNIESKMEIILSAFNNLNKYNKKLEEQIHILNNKLYENNIYYSSNEQNNNENNLDVITKSIENSLKDLSSDKELFSKINIKEEKNDLKIDNKIVKKSKFCIGNRKKKNVENSTNNNFLEELNTNIKSNNDPLEELNINIKDDHNIFNKDDDNIFNKEDDNIFNKDNDSLEELNNNIIDNNLNNESLKDNKTDKIYNIEIKKHNSTKKNKNIYKDIKKEIYNIDKDFIKECLHLCSIEGDIKLFKKIYIDNVPKECYPIRNYKKNVQYWNDGKMNEDINGNYIKNIIIENIENCYLSINNYQNYENDIDQLLKNQEYISKLNETRYKDKFLSSIIEIIKI